MKGSPTQNEISRIDQEINDLYADLAIYDSLKSEEFQKGWAVVVNHLRRQRRQIHATTQSGLDSQAHAFANGRLYQIDAIGNLPLEIRDGVQEDVNAHIAELDRLKQRRAAEAALSQEA